MTVTLDSTTNRIFKSDRDPNSDDYSIPIESGGIIVPSCGNFWKNSESGALFQCKSTVENEYVVWDKIILHKNN